MIKRSILQEDVAIIHMYAQSIRVPKKYEARQIILKELDSSTVIMRNFHTTLSING